MGELINFDKLKELGPWEISDIAELNVGGDNAGVPAEWILEIPKRLRDEVIEFDENDRWEVPRRYHEAYHEIADGMVPPYTLEMFTHLRIVGGAWRVDLDAFTEYAWLHGQWSNVPLGPSGGNTIELHARKALYLVYREGARKLVEWAQENQPDEDEAGMTEEKAPPEDMLSRAAAGGLTKRDVEAYPAYFISGPGRGLADATNCPHDYRLTDSCPGCDYDDEETGSK